MKNSIALFSLLLLITQVSQAQSPWTREKGKAYVQVGFSGLFYNQYQDDGKKVDLNADVSDVTLQAYAEYGLTNKLEAQLIIPYKTISIENSTLNLTEDHSGIGNISVGLKYKLSDKDWKVSSGVLFSANSNSRKDDSFLSTGFNSSTILPYISVGTSKNKWYYFGNIGYGYMNNDYSDYFRLNAEVGYNIIPKGHVILALDTRNIVSKEDAFLNDQYSWFSYSDRQTYNAFGLKFNYEFIENQFGANFSAFGAFGNDNAPLAPSINLGVYTKF